MFKFYTLAYLVLHFINMELKTIITLYITSLFHVPDLVIWDEPLLI